MKNKKQDYQEEASRRRARDRARAIRLV